jgi:hypothetical protein
MITGIQHRKQTPRCNHFTGSCYPDLTLTYLSFSRAARASRIRAYLVYLTLLMRGYEIFSEISVDM